MSWLPVALLQQIVLSIQTFDKILKVLDVQIHCRCDLMQLLDGGEKKSEKEKKD